MREAPRAHRAIEVIVAAAMAVATLPLLIATLIASAAVYRAWPVFVHERVGRDGVLFRFPKVRTLPPSTSAYADKFSIGGDRLPVLMKIVRRAHLDELLQLWLVVAGRMALVGPRPEMAVLHQRLSPVAAVERTSIRPGVTGLWQISVHCDGLICDRIEYDRLYVQHRSSLLDAWILWRTALKMVLGRRVHLFEVPAWTVRAAAPLSKVAPAESAFIDIRTGAAAPAMADDPVLVEDPALATVTA